MAGITHPPIKKSKLAKSTINESMKGAARSILLFCGKNSFIKNWLSICSIETKCLLYFDFIRHLSLIP